MLWGAPRTATVAFLSIDLQRCTTRCYTKRPNPIAAAAVPRPSMAHPSCALQDFASTHLRVSGLTSSLSASSTNCPTPCAAMTVRKPPRGAAVLPVRKSSSCSASIRPS